MKVRTTLILSVIAVIGLGIWALTNAVQKVRMVAARMDAL